MKALEGFMEALEGYRRTSGGCTRFYFRKALKGSITALGGCLRALEGFMKKGIERLSQGTKTLKKAL